MEASQVLPSTLYSLKNLLCWQSTATLSDTVFNENSQQCDKSSNSESLEENNLSTTNHSKYETSCHKFNCPIQRSTTYLASVGESDHQVDVYSTPIHLDHDRRLQQALLSKAEEIAITSSSAAAVIFNLALAMHLSVTKPDASDNDSCSSADEAHERRNSSCLDKVESLYELAIDLILHTMMFPDPDTFHANMLLAVVNNLGAVRLQRNKQEAALVSFQYLMNLLMLMVDRGIVIGRDCDRFFGNALAAENRFRITPLLAAAA